MVDPIKLASKPTAIDEVRESVVQILKMTLAQAEAGTIDSVAMILSHPDETWTDRASETLRFSEGIGRLEILKQKWIARYLEKEII